jgi:hypothetical protein
MQLIGCSAQGKTLCIISAVLTWLRESYARDAAGEVSDCEDDQVCLESSGGSTKLAGDCEEEPKKTSMPSWIVSSSERERQRRREQRAHIAELRAKRREAVARRLLASAQQRKSFSRKRVFVTASDGGTEARAEAATIAEVDRVSDESLVPTKVSSCTRYCQIIESVTLVCDAMTRYCSAAELTLSWHSFLKSWENRRYLPESESPRSPVDHCCV